jgi:beta-carotene hydroxylase
MWICGVFCQLFGALWQDRNRNSYYGTSMRFEEVLTSQPSSAVGAVGAKTNAEADPSAGNVSTGSSKLERIRVRREWVGASPKTLTNPTAWLFVATVLLLGVTSIAYLAGTLPFLLAILFNAIAIYMSFSVMHEAMHGIADSNRTINLWLGRAMGVLLMVSYPMFRAIHLEHHSHTNDPARDPDHYLSEYPMWMVPLSAFAIGGHYRREYYGRKLWKNRAELVEALLLEVVVFAAIAVAAATGHLATIVVLWLVPAVLASAFLALAFDYLPHYPYDSRERYHDTRIYPGRLGFVVLIGQNYHLIHHLWTTVPWYRYPRVYREILPELELRGVRIGWKVDPTPAGNFIEI